MAQGTCFVCSSCSHTIQAWDDGNPYYLDAHGQKQYAYHPNPKRELCTGNDSLYLCLDCGEESMVDSEAPVDHCVKCASRNFVDLMALEGKTCPVCKVGTYAADWNQVAIS